MDIFVAVVQNGKMASKMKAASPAFCASGSDSAKRCFPIPWLQPVTRFQYGLEIWGGVDGLYTIVANIDHANSKATTTR